MKNPALETIRKEIGSIDLVLDAALEAAYAAGLATHGPQYHNVTPVKWHVAIYRTEELFCKPNWFTVTATEQALNDCYAPMAIAAGVLIRCYVCSEYPVRPALEVTPDFEFGGR